MLHGTTTSAVPMGPSAGSCSSDLREINEAKVANILSYLDATVPATYGMELGKQRLPEASCASSAPLTVSALRGASNENGQTVVPSAVTPNSAHPSALSTATLLMNTVQDSSQKVYLGIKKRIETLQYENEVLQTDNAELRRRLEDVWGRDAIYREEIKASVHNEVTELRRELAQAKRRSSEMVGRLEAEKGQLSETVESLSMQLRQEMTRREDERHKLESANAAAVASLRSKWQAQEKASREKWKLAEAKRIKETTLQSLEPDIVLLLNRHKLEKSRMREEFENELRQRDEVIAAKDASVEELKSRIQREADAVLAREQKAFQDRLREETDRVQRHLEEERRTERSKRDQMEFFYEEQKQTLQQEISRLGKEVLSLKRCQTTEQASFYEAVAKEVAQVTGQSSEMLSQLKKTLMLEFTCREKEAKEENAKHLQEMEVELKRRCERERDVAISKVVHDLEQEHIRALTSARGSDCMLRDRCNQMARDVERLQVENELVRHQLASALEAKQKLEAELAALRESSDLSEKHIKAIEDRIKGQYESRLCILDNEWHKRLNEFEMQHVKEVCAVEQKYEALSRQLQIAESKHETEQKALEQRYNMELSHINERMLVAMTTKDNTIQSHADKILVLQEALHLREAELQRHGSLLQ